MAIDPDVSSVGPAPQPPGNSPASQTPGVLPEPRSLAWHQVWIEALLHPSAKTFEMILADPKAKISRACWWIAITSLISYVLSGLFILVFGNPLFQALPSMQEQAPPGAQLSTMLCMLPLIPVIALLALVIQAGLFHIFGRLLGGRGTFANMVYAVAAYTAPLSLVTGLISYIPVIQCLFIVLMIYALVLGVIAIKVVHHFEYGKAVGTMILYALVFILIPACIIFFLVLSGPSIGNVFSNIIQNLGTPMP